MANPTFRIFQPDRVHPDPSVMQLCVDAGPAHISIALQMKNGGELVGYEFYNLQPQGNETTAAEVLSESTLVNVPHGDVVVNYNTSESVLVPARFHQRENADLMLHTVHGDLSNGIILQEQLPSLELFNVYRIPAWLHNIISARFRSGQYWHVYTSVIRSLELRRGSLPETCIHVWFYPGHVIVTVYRDGRLQIIQSFVYEIPEDLSYNLLNLAEQFGLDPGEVPLSVSGLLERDSVVFLEMTKYFMAIEMDTGEGLIPPSGESGFLTYPRHYFTPVYSLCQCASSAGA